MFKAVRQLSALL